MAVTSSNNEVTSSALQNGERLSRFDYNFEKSENKHKNHENKIYSNIQIFLNEKENWPNFNKIYRKIKRYLKSHRSNLDDIFFKTYERCLEKDAIHNFKIGSYFNDTLIKSPKSKRHADKVSYAQNDKMKKQKKMKKTISSKKVKRFNNKEHHHHTYDTINQLAEEEPPNSSNQTRPSVIMLEDAEGAKDVVNKTEKVSSKTEKVSSETDKMSSEMTNIVEVLSCPEEHYKCEDGTQCIRSNLTCSGRPECPDESDESVQLCGEYYYYYYYFLIITLVCV